MAAPNSDHTDPIASTYQFRAFTDRDEVAEPAGRSSRGLVTATVVAAVLVLAVVVVVLVA
jgi:hypothetical protein